MNELLGTKFKIVTGYAGGNEINIAMERGEVPPAQQHLASLEGDQARGGSAEKKIYVIAQGGGARRRSRCARDRGSGQERGLTANSSNIIMSGAALGRPMATTPDVPEPRLKALRAAYMAVMKDPGIRGGDRQAQYRDRSGLRRGHAEVVAHVLATPKAVLERVEAVHGVAAHQEASCCAGGVSCCGPRPVLHGEEGMKVFQHGTTG